MKCYAAYAKDSETRKSGSSGGLFPVLSQHFITNNGGFVYASVYDADFNVVFERADDIESLKKCYASKYLQSRLNDTFVKIQKDLKEGKQVLFCGTPCQVNGLHSFLDKTKTSAEKLLLVDFICHGVPSEKAFHTYMDDMNPKCVSLNMRNKDLGWINGTYSWKISFEDGSESVTSQKDIKYMRGFLSNLFIRPSCYFCAARGNSSADITLGDFWGVDSVIKDIDYKLGVSAVIVRTQKGEEAFSGISNLIEMHCVEYGDILKGNSCLEKSVRMPFARRNLSGNISSVSELNQYIDKYIHPSLITRAVEKAYSKLPKRGYSVGDLKEPAHRLIYDRKHRCCGCTACYAVCKLGAIEMKQDKEGFFYPLINKEKCVNCGLCEKVCPFKA